MRGCFVQVSVLKIEDSRPGVGTLSFLNGQYLPAVSTEAGHGFIDVDERPVVLVARVVDPDPLTLMTLVARRPKAEAILVTIAGLPKKD